MIPSQAVSKARFSADFWRCTAVRRQSARAQIGPRAASLTVRLVPQTLQGVTPSGVAMPDFPISRAILASQRDRGHRLSPCEQGVRELGQRHGRMMDRSMAKKEKKQPRPKAAAPKIAEVYHSYGFDPLETSAIETVEALGKFLPDVDRPNEGVFGFQDDDESWIALRYDLTAPLARVAAQYRLDLPSPYRRYAMGPVWRNEKPGPGRFREFWQCDADTVGTSTVAADAEICGMLAAAMENAGIARDEFLVRVNNRKVMNGVLETANLMGEDQAIQRGITMRAIDKLDRLGEDGVRALLGAGRKDESGAFTDGANLATEQADIIMGFVQAERADGAATCARLRELIGSSETGAEGVNELEEIAMLLDAQGYGADRIKIDPSVVRGLGYYTGPVYEAELTFEIIDEKGQKRQFGSVAGGGRYDDLVMRFTGQRTPATGVSIGVDRLLAALTATNRLGAAQAQGPVVILALDPSRMAHYQSMCADLRNAGVRAEVFMGGGKNMGKQLKYADKRAAPLAIIEGGDEAGRGVVQIKDLVLGSKLAEEIESNEEWKAQPAQREIPAGDVVATVREMLAR